MTAMETVIVVGRREEDMAADELQRGTDRQALHIYHA